MGKALPDSPDQVNAQAADVPLAWRAGLWGMLAGKLVSGWGVRWDIDWHVRIGRDSFWIAPHLMTYFVQPLIPAWPETAIALAITLSLALVSGLAARRLADALAGLAREAPAARASLRGEPAQIR